MTIAFKYSIGQTVRHVVRLHAEDLWTGHIVAREFYESGGQNGIWYYVRWIAPCGEPRGDLMRMNELEIQSQDEHYAQVMRSAPGSK